MSASLVGSEMCIRDRSLAVSFHEQFRELIINIVAHPRALLRSAELGLAVSYTTSDAADDM
eukprot:6003985-Alexandrium_andersonii.AAC.1